MAETDVVAQSVVTAESEADNHIAASDGNQQGESDWTKDFDEGLRKKVEKFKTPKDLATGYTELEAYQSKSFQDMTPDQQEKYLKRLGLPEKPEEYELSAITLPEGHSRPVTAASEFKAIMKELKLTKDQGKRLDDWMMKRAADSIIAQRTAVKKRADENESALRTSWAASYEANNANVEKLIKFGGDKFVQVMNNGPGKDAVIREGLYAISKLIAEETFEKGRVEERNKTSIPSGFVFDVSKSPELLQ